jgi:hypothetical protein
MAIQRTFFGRAKSISGATLIGLGIFILHEKLDGAATQLNHLLGTIPGQALGVLPTIILGASRFLQIGAADHQRFLQGFLQHMLVSFWPLLLVMVGMVLSRDAFTDNVDALPKKRLRTCRSDYRLFDVKVEATLSETQKET